MLDQFDRYEETTIKSGSPQKPFEPKRHWYVEIKGSRTPDDVGGYFAEFKDGWFIVHTDEHDYQVVMAYPIHTLYSVSGGEPE